MKMKFMALALLLVCPLSNGEIYKCMDDKGKTSFADRPCPQNTAQETVGAQPTPWTKRLITQKSPAISILHIDTHAQETTIQYEFKTASDSNGFMRLVHKLSGQPVVLLKILPATKVKMGSATLKASDKPNPVLGEIKNAAVYEQPLSVQNDTH